MVVVVAVVAFRSGSRRAVAADGCLLGRDGGGLIHRFVSGPFAFDYDDPVDDDIDLEERFLFIRFSLIVCFIIG